MMTHLEVHDRLARMIGDPIYQVELETAQTRILDGVRYSAVMRAAYLEQAGNDIYLSAIKSCLQYPDRSKASLVLQRLFPNMTTVTEPILFLENTGVTEYLPDIVSPDPSKIAIEKAIGIESLWVYSVRLVPHIIGSFNRVMRLDNKFIPCLEFNNYQRITGASHIHQPGFLSTVRLSPTGNNQTEVIINIPKGTRLLQNTKLYAEISHLPKCIVDSKTNPNNIFRYEQMWMGELLRRAAVYAQNDDGTIDGIIQSNQILSSSILQPITQG